MSIRGNRIVAIANGLEPSPAAQTIDASGWLVLPGLVNAHHHLSQQLTRTRACEATLVEWLIELYPVWSAVDEEVAFHGARVGVAELLLTGTTTVSDFTYFYPRGREQIFDAQVAAARELGCRFAPVRGGLTEFEAGVRAVVGDSLDHTLEDVETLLAEIDRVVAEYHDPRPDSLCRVGVGLTEKAYGDAELMRRLAEVAEERDLRMHTHLHPRADERRFAHERLGLDPIGYLEQTGWWSERLWVAHGTALTDDEVGRLARQRVTLCTCPSSNARFGTQIAPAFALDRAGGSVAVGVDGAASNDASDMVGECRLALQVQRIRAATDGDRFADVTPGLVLDWATAGGAAALGWPELGRLEEGGLADLACFDLAQLDYVGASNPLAALLLCGTAHRAALVVVDGRVVVQDGQLVSVDEGLLVREARKAEQTLWDRAQRAGSAPEPKSRRIIVAEAGS